MPFLPGLGAAAEGARMTDEEFAEWGLKEDAIRKTELENISSAEALKTVQRACAKRRKMVGLTAGQAARAITVARRVARGESLDFAFRKR